MKRSSKLKEASKGDSNVMTKTEDGACLSAMLLSTNLVYLVVLNAAIELNLFEIIAKATPAGSFMSSHEIASKLPTQHPDLPNRLDRMLRFLASYSVLLVSTLDNLMFITVDGRERTQKQYETLCMLSGFLNFQVACRAFSSLGVMEFYK